MKLILLLSIFLLFSCKQANDNNMYTATDAYKHCSILDTLIITSDTPFLKDYSVEALVKFEKFGKANIKVNYWVGTNNTPYYSFRLLNTSFKIVKDSCNINNKFITSFYKNNAVMLKHIVYVKDSLNFGFDNLLVDYTYSDLYFNNKGMILLKNMPERNVGKATNWNYYQLLDLNKNEMYEFYYYRYTN